MIAQLLTRRITRPLVRSILTEPDIAPDPDATSRIAQIQAAKGSSISPLQRAAIHTFIRAEKAAGRWATHKRIYLPIWGNPAANAIDLVTGATGTWVNASTHAPGYIRTDGATSYFNTGTSPTLQGITNASGSIWKIVILPDTRNDGRYSGARGPASERFSIGQSGSATINTAIGAASSPGNAAATNATGIVIGSCDTIASRFSAVRRAAGWTILTTQTTTETTPLLNLNLYFGAWNNNNSGPGVPSDEALGGFGFGLGLTQAAAAAFTANLQTLWETASGLTLPDADALSYIAAVETARGSAMTSVQRIALNTFVKAEKTSGRWSSHKRLFLPIWGNAAANAICLRTLATGTWINAPTQAAGYVQGNGTNQYFSMGASLAGVGASVNSASYFVLAAPGSPDVTTMSAFASLMGARDVGDAGNTTLHRNGTGVTTFSGRLGSIASPAIAAVHDRITLVSRDSDGLRVVQRNAAGVTITPGSATAPSALPAANMAVMAGNLNGTIYDHSTFRIGAHGMGLGFSEAQSSAFTDSLKTLWETATGLTLP